jgi:hypothetical protein
MLLLVYRAFLGTENLYRFNRFYLLFSLLFSLIVPATTIHVPYVSMPDWGKLIVNKSATVIADRPAREQTTTYPMPVVVNQPVQPQTAAPAIMEANGNADNYTITPSIPQVAISAPTRNDVAPTPQSTRNYLPEILLALYSLITLVLLCRFVWNSYHISRVVASSTIIDYQDTKLVLVTDDVTPHSFLKYVFLNKAAYYNKTIEPEIICHEQTHVRQLHSLDVIWVEILQIVCWFNFFIPLYRKAIQLNHEFLADEAVIENYQDTPAYQHLLLAKASQSGSLYLTSQFNYLVTKKRIIMMTKRTTAAIALYKQLALLPVLAVAIFLFSQKSLAQVAKKAQAHKPVPAKKVEPKTQSTAVEAAAQDAPQSVLDEYAKILAKYGIPYKKGEKINYTPDFSAIDKERVAVLYKQMSHKQQQHQYIRLAHVPPPPRLKFSEKDFKQWQTNAGYMVYIDDKQIKNSDLARHKISDFPNVLLSQTPVPSAKSGWRWKVTLMTPTYYNEYLRKGDKLHFIYMPKKYWKSTNWPIAGVVFVNKQVQVMPAARQDAPTAITDEYTAILAKYGLKQYMKRADFKDIDIWNPHFFAEADRARLLALYKQMSKKQQDQQVIAFNASPPPLPKNQPTEQQLAAWKNAKEYGVWINNKKINNNELNKYKAADFDLYLIARLTPIARRHTQCHYQINLSTKANYAVYYKQAKAKEGRPNVLVHIVPDPADASDPAKVTVDTRILVGEGRHLPLLVVNGKPFEKPIPIDFNFNKATNAEFAQLLGVPENNISKIKVLKKEEATKQWGEKGVYGVLMIYTDPGMEIKVRKNANQPLVIIDGKPVDKPIPADFNYATASNNEYATVLSIKSSDIETISVFKDAAAIARGG